MKTRYVPHLALAGLLGVSVLLRADPAAKVTEKVNDVQFGSGSERSPASVGTAVNAGEYLETGSQSRAELLLPTTSITRMGSNTIFNYSPESNTVDLQAGTTGFVSVQGSPNSRQKTYIFGIIEGRAAARANGQNFSVGAGDILEFKIPNKPFLFAYDVPRFVKSSPLLTKFKSRLPNQSAIDAELANYQDEVSRGFIQPPSRVIDYSADIPIISMPAYDSAQNSQGQSRGGGGGGAPPGSAPPSGIPGLNSSH
jgi:hypothetical protein